MDFRRTACALALPLFPLALLAGSLVSPTDSIDNAVQLTAAGAHGPAWVGSTMLELLATALLPLAVAGVVQVARGRGFRLATAAAALGVLGTIGLASIAFRHAFIYGLAGIGQPEALQALDRVDQTFGPVVFPLMFCAPIALVVTAFAAVRAGIAPRWIPAGAIAFTVVDMLPLPEAEAIQGAIGLVAFATLARGILARQDHQPRRSPVTAPIEA